MSDSNSDLSKISDSGTDLSKISNSDSNSRFLNTVVLQLWDVEGLQGGVSIEEVYCWKAT